MVGYGKGDYHDRRVAGVGVPRNLWPIEAVAAENGSWLLFKRPKGCPYRLLDRRGDLLFFQPGNPAFQPSHLTSRHRPARVLYRVTPAKLITGQDLATRVAHHAIAQRHPAGYGWRSR